MPPIVGHGADPFQAGWAFIIQPIPICHLQFGGNFASSSPGVEDLRWHHVAAVYDAGMQSETCYVDGDAGGTVNGARRPLVPVDAGLEIGRGWRGWLAEIRISSTARYSASFVPARRFAPDGSTLALYPLDEGAGQIARDASGNGHDASLQGAARLGAPPMCP